MDLFTIQNEKRLSKVWEYEMAMTRGLLVWMRDCHVHHAVSEHALH